MHEIFALRLRTWVRAGVLPRTHRVHLDNQILTDARPSAPLPRFSDSDGCDKNFCSKMIFLVAALSFGAGSRDEDGMSLFSVQEHFLEQLFLVLRCDRLATSEVCLRCKTNRARR